MKFIQFLLRLYYENALKNNIRLWAEEAYNEIWKKTHQKGIKVPANEREY